MNTQVIGIDEIGGRRATAVLVNSDESNNSTETKLHVSEFLRIIDQGDDVLLYHTLFGMPLVVPRDVLSLFEIVRSGEQIGLDQIPEEDVKVFRDYYFLVPGDIDERVIHADMIAEYVKNSMDGKNIGKLDLLISEACNFGCGHCIYFNSMDAGDNDRANKIMKFDQAKLTIDKYVEIMCTNNLAHLDIHFGAAEPLLNWKTLKACVEYVESEYPQYTCHFSLNTNLSLLTHEIALFLKEHKVAIHVSLDGNKESNDAIRTLKNGQGTHDLILNKMALLKQIQYPLTGISLTITEKNYHLVDVEYVHWCKEQGFTSLAFDVDLLNAVQLEGVTVRTVSEKLVRLYTECEKLGIEGFGTWTAPFLNIKHKSVLEGEVPYFCSAVKGRSMAVSANGNVTTCSYTTTKIGNIDSIKFGVTSQLGKLVQSRTPGVNPFCKGCAIEGHCGGQCHSTREVALSQGNKEILPKMCELYRTTTSMLLEHELSKAVSDQ